MLKRIKCVVVGDGAVGKTCLLISYSTNTFPSEYTPTVFDNYEVTVMHEDTAIGLQLWDTAGQEDYTQLRPLSYPGTDIFLICFSLVFENSLKNVERIWLPEITQNCPNTPYILVGLKSDLRDEFSRKAGEYKAQGLEPIPSSKGEEIKNKIGAQCYIECSALKQYNLKEVFDTAVRIALSAQNQTNTDETTPKDDNGKKCMIM